MPAHVSNNSGDNEWYTPHVYIEAARLTMGEIDLDPASTKVANQVVKATTYYTVTENGLLQPWFGRVWMNPPYAQPLIRHFCAKVVSEYKIGTIEQAVVLVNNATETNWFQDLAGNATAICLPRGRINFWAPDKVKAAPLQGQTFIYFGKDCDAFDHHFSGFGLVAVMRH